MSRKNSCLTLVLVLICGVALVIPASAQHFKQIAVNLTSVAVGRNEVFALNASGQVYRFNPGTKTFGLISGTSGFLQVAVGGGTLQQRDEIWALNAAGNTYRFNFGTKTFVAVPGVLSQIVVGEGYQDNCHPYEVWGINPSSNVYRYNYCTHAWNQIPIPNPFTHIATGGGDVWGLDEFAQIWYLGSGWTQVPGFLQQITVGVNDIWGLDSAGNAYRYFADGSGFLQYVTEPPNATQIAGGGDGVWAITNSVGEVWRFDANLGWGIVTLPSPYLPVQIASGYGAGVWVVNSIGQVFIFVRP